jgi:hypothetical protein
MTTQRRWRFATQAEILAQIKAARARERIEAKTEPRALHARYDSKSGLVVIELTSGAFFGFPARASRWLQDASEEDLTNVEVYPGGGGLRWDRIDVDLSVPGLIQNSFGSKTWMRELGRAGGRSRSAAKVRAARANGRKGGRPRKKSAR